jgi:glycosyltransferase involved in cell wall biosynthesis
MRLLLVAFYFPPAGGGGVQRTLKFCRHLADLGVEVHVLAPSDPKWFARDEPLLEQIPETTHVHRSRFVGPASTFRADAVGDRTGIRRIGAEIRYTSSLMLVPDKTLPWALTAVPAGIRIVRDQKIDVVMSTSPPASVHLIAEAISVCTRRPFVADFRDSWLDNPHRTYDRMSVRAKRAVNARMAQSVGRRSSAMVAATGAIAQELGHLAPGAAAKTTVIENGADFDEFAALSPVRDDRFTIVHAGSFFGARTPRPFLEALRTVLDRRPELRGRVRARFLGDLRPEDRAWAEGLGLDGALEEDGFVPHRDSLTAQRSADALLLLIPHADGRGDTVLSGKVFEYIASGRPILAAVPPDGVAANLLRSVGAGEVADSDDVEGIAGALERLVDRWLARDLPDISYPQHVQDRLSRQSRARDLATVLTGVAG